MFDLKDQDPFQSGLGNAGDAAAADVLAQQHTEIGGGHGIRFIGFGKVDKGKACSGGDK